MGELLQKQVDRLEGRVGKLETLESSGGGVTTATLPLAITGSNIAISVTPANPGGAVALQATTPGTQQTGNENISGKLIAGGDVAAVGNVSGVNVTATGTVQGATVNGTTNVQVNSVNVNPIPKNWLINGNMDACQRYGPAGSAVVAAGGNGSYVLDRWRSKRDGSGTVTVSQQAFTVGQTDVPGEPTYFLRHAQTVAGTGATFNIISQYIEDVRTFAGQTVTVSEYLKADASRTVNVRFRQFFGTGGSADVTTSNVAASVTTSWTKFTSAGISIPSVSGKTITADSALVLEFQLPLNTAITIELAQVQVEAGANAGAFQKKNLLEELRDCYRYYRKCFQYSVAPANSQSSGALLNSLPPALAGTFYLPSIPLGVALRISPATGNLTFYNSGGGTAGQAFNFTRSNSSTAISLNAAGSSETVIAFQITAFPVGWVANDLFSVAYVVDVDFYV